MNSSELAQLLIATSEALNRLSVQVTNNDFNKVAVAPVVLQRVIEALAEFNPPAPAPAPTGKKAKAKGWYLWATDDAGKWKLFHGPYPRKGTANELVRQYGGEPKYDDLEITVASASALQKLYGKGSGQTPNGLRAMFGELLQRDQKHLEEVLGMSFTQGIAYPTGTRTAITSIYDDPYGYASSGAYGRKGDPVQPGWLKEGDIVRLTAMGRKFHATEEWFPAKEYDVFPIVEVLTSALDEPVYTVDLGEGFMPGYSGLQEFGTENMRAEHVEDARKKGKADKPQEGKVYNIMDVVGVPSIASGASWEEAEVKSQSNPGHTGGGITLDEILADHPQKRGSNAPALPHERRKGSKKNRPGSAAGKEEASSYLTE